MLDLVHKLVVDNRGYFTRGEALAAGCLDRDLHGGLRSGKLVRLRQGIYAPAAAYRTMTEVQRHRVLARGVLKVQRGGVALAGPTAAAFHGLRLYNADMSKVHLVRLDGGPSRHHAGAVHHRVGPEIADHLVKIDGVWVTSLVRTVWDVARTASLEGGVTAADSALAVSSGLLAELEELADRFGGHPGARRARLVIRLADGRSDSVGESVTRVQFYRYSVPNPDLQYTVLDGYGQPIGTADFYWHDCRHLGEFDGKVKYLKYLRDGETPSDCVFREKRREDRMRDGMRGMSRFDWASVMRKHVRSTMSDLVTALERSRRLYVFTGQVARLGPTA